MFDSYSWTQIISCTLGWSVISALPMWYTIYSSRKKCIPDPVRDAKFLPFIRHDSKKWSYCSALFKNLFFLPRACIAWGAVIVSAFVVLLLDCGTDIKKPMISWRKATFLSVAKRAA